MSNKVLIAHGNTPRLKRAVADLQAAGFEVVATPDGGDAFARFFEEMPELVICSEALPGLSGKNFARMVRSQSPETPVVILIEEASGSTIDDEFTVLADPLDLGALRSAFPALVPELLPQPSTDGEAEASATPTDVFTLAALKRFQRGSNILALLDEPGIVGMARIAQHQSRSDGDQVIRQGDVGDGFYLVVEGQVRVTLAEKENAEVARITEGGFFGEMAMLSDQPRSASVWSVGNTTLLYFSRVDFMPFLDAYPTLREVLGGVALKRTEENLWRVLFADDDVQRSIAELGEAPKDELVEAAAPAPADALPETPPAAPNEAPAELPPLPQEVAVGAPASLVARLTTPRAPFISGLTAGLALGVLLTMFLLPAAPEPSGAPIAEAPPPPSAPDPVRAPEPTPTPTPTEAAPSEMQPEAPQPQPQPTEAPEPASAPAPAPDAPEAPAPTEPTVTPKPEAEASALPGDRKELRKLLLTAYKDSDWKTAVASGRKLRDAFGLDWEAEYALADSERNSGEHDAALATFASFIEKYPTNVKADDAQFYSAELLWARGDRDSARKLYQALVDNPKSDFKTSAQKRLETK